MYSRHAYLYIIVLKGSVDMTIGQPSVHVRDKPHPVINMIFVQYYI